MDYYELQRDWAIREGIKSAFFNDFKYSEILMKITIEKYGELSSRIEQIYDEESVPFLEEIKNRWLSEGRYSEPNIQYKLKYFFIELDKCLNGVSNYSQEIILYNICMECKMLSYMLTQSLYPIDVEVHKKEYPLINMLYTWYYRNEVMNNYNIREEFYEMVKSKGVESLYFLVNGIFNSPDKAIMMSIIEGVE